MNGLTIAAKQFGPVHEAAISIRPLTIFIGSNNTGKSYIAQLIYAISRAMSKEAGYSVFEHSFEDAVGISKNLSEGSIKSLDRYIPNDYFVMARTKPHYRKRVDIAFNTLSEEVKNAVNQHLSTYLRLFKDNLVGEMERCFDAKISNLTCKVQETKKGFEINIESLSPILSISLVSSGNNFEEKYVKFSAENNIFNLQLPRFDLNDLSEHTEDVSKFLQQYLRRLATNIIFQSDSILSKAFPTNSYYLPAARSGILQGQKAIVRTGLRSMQRAGMDSISIPKLPGNVIDFLNAIYSINRDTKGVLYSLAKHIEQRLIPGRIEYVESKELPEIYLRQPSVGRLSLHRTSSMVSELAPIILLVRYLIADGDMMIIEEPESHMHPGAQRAIAVLLAKLVNSGVNVLITTHSDYLLQQLSNLVALSQKPEQQRTKMGYKSDEILSPEKVSAFLFKSQKDNCSSVTSLEVGENGISEEGFGSIAESLYQEAIEVKMD